MMSKRTLMIGVAAATAMGMAACSAQSDGSDPQYPTSAITIVVPVSAGSSTDLSARILSTCLETELDTTVIVENREGGSGAVGNTFFARAKADGYTLAATTAANAVLPPLMEPSVTFSADDFLPIGTIGQAPILMLGRDGERSAEDLLESAATDRLLVGVPGATSVPAIVVDGLSDEHDLNIEVVPFDGNGNTLQALRAKDVDAIFVSADANSTLPALQDGDVVALATAVTDEIAHLPEVVTLESLGYGNLPYADSFWFLATQPETPEPVVDVLAGAMQTCMSNDQVRQQIGEFVAPAEFIDGAATQAWLNEAAHTYAERLG